MGAQSKHRRLNGASILPNLNEATRKFKTGHWRSKEASTGAPMRTFLETRTDKLKKTGNVFPVCASGPPRTTNDDPLHRLCPPLASIGPGLLRATPVERTCVGTVVGGSYRGEFRLHLGVDTGRDVSCPRGHDEIRPPASAMIGTFGNVRHVRKSRNRRRRCPSPWARSLRPRARRRIRHIEHGSCGRLREDRQAHDVQVGQCRCEPSRAPSAIITAKAAARHKPARRRLWRPS
jgi:hypothetical protein